VFIMTEKLGSKTRAKWNDKLDDIREYPSNKELDAFLSSRIHSLSEFAGVANTVVDNLRNKGRSFVNNVSVQNCVNCAGSHSLAKCEKFLSLSVEQRSIFARKKRVCFNCLRSGHFMPSVQVNRDVCIIGARITPSAITSRGRQNY